MPERKLVTFDWAMEKLLRSKANFEILEGFLSELLMDDIRILEILEIDANKEHQRGRFNGVDFKVSNGKGEIVIIEVQYEREFDYLQKILFGTSRVLFEHLQKKLSYSEITKVISVSILFFDLGHGKDYVYHGITSFRGLYQDDLLSYSKEEQRIYGKEMIHETFPEYYLLKVSNFNDVVKNNLDEWIYFLKNNEIKEEFNARGLKKAGEELDTLKLSMSERLAYSWYQDDLRYQASMAESLYISAMMDGRNKGIEKGKQEGIEEGRKAEKRAIALKLLAYGLFDIQQIAEMTEMTTEEIIMLEQNLQ